MELSDELRRGDMARLVLENPIYVETMQSLRDGIMQAWENAPIRDKEGQNELKLMLKLLGDLQRNIETVMQTGKMAKIQIERESVFRKTVNRFR